MALSASTDQQGDESSQSPPQSQPQQQQPQPQQQQDSDDDTAELLMNGNSSQPTDAAGGGGLCGAIPVVNMKGHITDLKQRGRGVISKLRRQSASGDDSIRSGDVAAASLYDPALYNFCSGVDCDDDGDNVVATAGGNTNNNNAVEDADLDENDEAAAYAATRKRAIMEQEPIPASVLLGSTNTTERTICVITTAAMPWRTGTAVNPLLRALYLVRFQNERRRELELQQQQQQQQQQEGQAAKKKKEEEEAIDNDANHDAIINSSDNEKKKIKQGSVVLVIPWLESEEDRIKLYGPKNAFISNGSRTGIQQQEEWIRSYSSERCGMPNEAAQLQMIFYPAFYLAGFGSIFPKVDLCNFIPREMVDVAILEEPEHLNWFRMPNDREVSRRDVMISCNMEDDGDGDDHVDHVEDDAGDIEEKNNGGLLKQHDEKELNTRTAMSAVGKSNAVGPKVEVTINESRSDHDLMEIAEKNDDVTDVHVVVNEDSNTSDIARDGSQLEQNCDINAQHQQAAEEQQQSHHKKYTEKTKLGWTHRFNFVVGIVHTNYEAYARQYGIGASLIAAPAIGAVSALSIRAYCHQVIKLSDTLPSFAPGKEVTCNVHGVRREFLEGVDLNVFSKGGGKSMKNDKDDSGKQLENGKDADDDNDEEPSPVYFIGKLVWAKGFDLMLALQDIFRKRNGEYFPIDVYGGGPDEKAIARAFHGRNHATPTKRPPPPPSTTNSKDASLPSSSSQKDLNALAVLTNPQSIKDQSSQVIEQMKQRQSLKLDGDDVVTQYLSLGFEVCQMNGVATYVNESRRRLESEGEDESKNNPLDILGDLSGKSFDTGVKTSEAVYNIADSSIKNILTMSFSQLKHPLKSRGRKDKPQTDAKSSAVVMEDVEKVEGDKPRFVFDPPASRYEWRRHPIPAKFPGVIDHAQLKNVPHKIFLNPSTSEVLCTTTAEALAMNKFVILPKHPSNDFFMQFTNCLSYNTLEECAEKMAWALDNAPAKLSDEERRKFTWEAATERLMKSSIVTVKQARERSENGMDKTDARIAYWLSESGEKGNMLRNLFHKNASGDHSPMVDG